jgi:DNA-binding response OmpR family regulator
MERKKILIIDDDPATVREVKLLACSDEFEIAWAADGQDGLKRLKTTRPDLILLDLVLPDTSGFRIAQELKRLPAAKQIPIIAISLKRESIDKHVALKSGILEYMVKPLDPDRLSFLLRDILEK